MSGAVQIHAKASVSSLLIVLKGKVTLIIVTIQLSAPQCGGLDIGNQKN